MRMQCPNCGKRIRVADAGPGKRIKCPRCQLKIALPATVQPSPEPVAETSHPVDELASPDRGVLANSEAGHQQIESRVKEHGLTRMILGGSLLVLGVASVFLGRFFPWTLLATLACLAQGGRELYWGINAYYSYLVPELFPADLRRHTADGEDIVQSLLLKRIIVGTYLMPAGFLKRIATAFVPKFRYLTPVQLPLFDAAGFLCIASLLGLIALVIGFMVVWVPAVFLLTEMVLIGATAICVTALQWCIPGERKPKEAILEQPKDQRSFVAGNTTDLINHLVRDVFVAIREDDRFNRDLWPAPKMETGTDFDLVLGQETEPRLINESTTVPVSIPIFLERSGAGFVAGGWFLLFFLPAPIPFISSAVGLPAIAIGWWFLAMAYRIRNSFRFVSDIFRLELHGSSTSKQPTAEILGRGGTLQRETLHTSNVYWMLHSARVVSECSMASTLPRNADDPTASVRNALMSPRYVVRVLHDDELVQRMDIIASRLTDFEDVREKRDSKAVQQMVESDEMIAQRDQSFKQQNIQLEKQLDTDGQKELEQIRQQGRLREKLFEKIVDQMAPEDLQRLARGDDQLPLADVGPTGALPAPSSDSPKEINRQLIAALRIYLNKRNPAEDRLGAKDTFDELVQTHNIGNERIAQLTELVQEEMQEDGSR